MGLSKIAKRASTVPGITIYTLTQDWAGLPAGTDVTPLNGGSAGYKNKRYQDVHRQTVSVQSGPRKGETVTGEIGGDDDAFAI